MRDSIFDYVGNLDTLIAVIVGACLATGGSLVAEIIQDRLGRRRRQRDSARFFGEMISSIVQIFDLAKSSQSVGEPWGAYSVNLFRVAATEAETYSRNRERLFDIHDMRLRFAIHGHILRFTVPIASMVQESDQISELQNRLAEEEGLSESATSSIHARIERLEAIRDGGMRQASEQREISMEILSQLEEIAGTRFEAEY